MSANRNPEFGFCQTCHEFTPAGVGIVWNPTHAEWSNGAEVEFWCEGCAPDDAYDAVRDAEAFAARVAALPAVAFATVDGDPF